MKKIKRKKIILSGIFVIALLGLLSIHFVAPYFILQPSKVNPNIKPEDLNLVGESIEIAIDDEQNLRGYWIESAIDTSYGVMILVHGIGGAKEHFLGLAKQLAMAGIETLILDGRAHGESGGEYCTYGFHEKEDIVKIVDFIKAKEPDLSLGIWGNSLGGAIALQALERDQRIEFGIIESTFSDLRTIVFDYKKRILKGIGIKILSDYVLDRAGEIADFDPDQVKPIRSVTNIEQAVLIAHGDADKNIDIKYGQALYEQLKSKDKKFVRVSKGMHEGLAETGGEEYTNTLMEFIQRQIRK